MIISHKLKCIYIKNVKVAGSSFEIALSKYCGEDDIITPTGKYDGTMKSPEFYSPRNYRTSNGDKFRSHMPASKIKTLVPPDVWNNYLKIATIRCPYDVVISRYYWEIYQETISDKCDFSDFIVWYGIKQCRPHFPEIHIKGKLITNFKIRYEHLDKDIKELGTKINCPGLLDTFQGVDAKADIRPREGTTPCEMYAKYPAVKSNVDKIFYRQQNEYEFIRKYWSGYKAKLEEDIAKYQLTKNIS